MFKQLFSASMLALIAISTAYAENFTCPQPSEIQSTDFTAPSIWVAPPVTHSVPNTVGVGLGGKVVKELLGIEKAEINHKPGWVCVYRSEGGISTFEYQFKIREIVMSNRYLKKYIKKVDKAFADAEPYLRNYPRNTPVGFVGYQKEEEQKSH
jgi:hypothetical protein